MSLLGNDFLLVLLDDVNRVNFFLDNFFSLFLDFVLDLLLAFGEALFKLGFLFASLLICQRDDLISVSFTHKPLNFFTKIFLLSAHVFLLNLVLFAFNFLCKGFFQVQISLFLLLLTQFFKIL